MDGCDYHAVSRSNDWCLDNTTGQERLAQYFIDEGFNVKMNIVLINGFNDDEIIDFIGGLANTIPIEIIKKGQPYYGNYIMQQRSYSKE